MASYAAAPSSLAPGSTAPGSTAPLPGENPGGAVPVGRVTDAELLRVLHDEHAAALLLFVLRLTGGDRGHAEDVVQETLLRAWRHPRVLDQSAGSARAWLFTVARRIVIDDWRTRRARVELVTADPPEQRSEDPSAGIVDRALIDTAVSQLSAEHRAILTECYLRGASVAQAAQTLGIPPGTVKSRTHYALHALRAALQQMGAVS